MRSIDDLNDSVSRVLKTFVNDPDKPQRLRLCSPKRVNKIWADSARTGIVRDTKGMQRIADICMDNIEIIYANTYLAGHTQCNPDDEFECYGIDPEDERFEDHILDREQGCYRVSDYAMGPLIKDYIELCGTMDADKQLLIVDRIFCRVHRRSNLSAWFIEGGSLALDELRDQEIQHEYSR